MIGFEINNMRVLATILFLNLLLQSVCAREISNINAGWLYQEGDVAGAQYENYDDSDWEYVGLPHSFSMPYFMAKDFYVGYGWYRKGMRLDKKGLKKRIFLNSTYQSLRK